MIYDFSGYSIMCVDNTESLLIPSIVNYMGLVVRLAMWK